MGVAAAAELRLPDAILPKYADFVYPVMLRAIKFRAHLHWLDRADQACLFCPTHETYRHFLVDCDLIKDVWSTLHAVTGPLGVTLPTTLSGFLYSTPKTASNMHQAAFRYLWPVLRACVWFNVWRVRNDRVFRADLPLPSPWTIAVKAARVAQLHLHHSPSSLLFVGFSGSSPNTSGRDVTSSRGLPPPAYIKFLNRVHITKKVRGDVVRVMHILQHLRVNRLFCIQRPPPRIDFNFDRC